MSHIHLGTSGWTYDDWTGPFYPENVKGPERLSFYAERFDTVEVNATFYRLPFRGMITGWNRRLPPEFHLVLKGPRSVTHLKKLRDCDNALTAFLDRVAELRTLKVILWQLPPSLHKDPERLDRFLSALPETVRHAVEFRHESWWDGDTREVLSRNRAAFVAISHPKLPDTLVPTTDVLYLRFHGLGRRLYDYDYSREELLDWVQKVKPHLRGRELYAFFNNDVGARAPLNAATFRRLLEEAG
ncbi:MAG: DUF72 domain-containing protein [Gemmatimonadales bacterium]